MSTISWIENGMAQSARWRSENGAPPPERIEIAGDALTANSALRRIRGGAGLLWRGDFPGARQLLTAIGRRADRRPLPKSLDLPGRFRAHRAARAERAELLGGIVVVIEPDLRLALRRAPDLAGACREAYGELSEPAMVSLNELLGVLSAWQWRSEEHTSELQSRGHLVCRLLLEKKKIIKFKKNSKTCRNETNK